MADTRWGIADRQCTDDNRIKGHLQINSSSEQTFRNQAHSCQKLYPPSRWRWGLHWIDAADIRKLQGSCYQTWPLLLKRATMLFHNIPVFIAQLHCRFTMELLSYSLENSYQISYRLLLGHHTDFSAVLLWRHFLENSCERNPYQHIPVNFGNWVFMLLLFLTLIECSRDQMLTRTFQRAPSSLLNLSMYVIVLVAIILLPLLYTMWPPTWNGWPISAKFDKQRWKS